MTTISVAMCTHDGARYVAEQVASILAQSRPVDELVVSDDASVDGQVEVVEAAVAEWRDGHGNAPKLTVLRNPVPLGVTANFERALLATTGDLVALSDQDDVWTPDKVARMADVFAERASLDLLHTDARLITASGAPLGATLLDTLAVTAWERDAEGSGSAREVLMRRNIVTGATTMVHRRLVDRAAPFPAEWVHDEWLAIVAAIMGEVGLLTEPLIDYRQHGGNQIGATALTGSGRLRRLRTHRTARNAMLLGRAEALAARVGGLRPEVSAESRALVAEKLAHERARSALPAHRLSRVAPVVREWRTGRYGTCGLGAQDVLRDLVQPV